MRSRTHPAVRAIPWTRLAASCLVVLALIPSPAQADESGQLVVGLAYIANVEGNQGELDLLTTPVVASYRIDRLQVKVSTSYLVQANPAAGVRYEPDGRDTGPANFRSGLGDTNVAIGYAIPVASNIWIDVTGKAKFPTAAKNVQFGTGSTDWSLQGEVTRYIGGYGVSLRVSQKFSGASKLYDLSDPWNVGIGAFVTKGGTVYALDYDRRGSSFEGGTVRDEFTVSFSHTLQPYLRMQAYGFVTVAGSQSDVGLGTQVVARFGS